MACGCRKNQAGSTLTADQTAQAVAAGSQVYYEVDVDGTFTGRRFTTLLAANSYAQQRGGDVRTTK